MNVNLKSIRVKIQIGLIIFIFWSIPSFSQIQTNFKFFDNCSGNVVVLDYELSNQDTTISSIDGQTKVEFQGIYLLSTTIVRDEITCFYNFHLDIKQAVYDTLFLYDIALCNEGTLHSRNNFYYNCEQVTDDYLSMKDKNGIVRTEGSFEDGWPKGKLKYYNEEGKLISTEIHRNGKFIKIK